MSNRELKQDILHALTKLVEQTPDLRFGQLIANLAVIARGPTPEAVWDMEDDELLEAVKSHIEDYERRRLTLTRHRSVPNHFFTSSPCSIPPTSIMRRHWRPPRS